MSILIVSPEARIDLQDIHDYIAESNPINAERFIDRIEEGLERLSRRPLMGRLREDIEGGIRSFSIERYLILYRPIEDGIEVVRIASPYRDIDSLFQTPPSLID